MKNETVTLYSPNDLERGKLSPDGAFWVEIFSDDSESPSYCDICDQPIGLYDWLCMDGGECVCNSHVEIVPAWLGLALTAEFTETIAAQNRLVSMRCEIGRAMVESFAARQMPNRYLGWVEPIS